MWIIQPVGVQFKGFNLNKFKSYIFQAHKSYTILTPFSNSSRTQIVQNSIGRNKSSNYKAVFIGSDNFSVPSLIALTQLLGVDVSVVVSNYNNILGKYATKNSLNIIHWNDYKTEDFLKEGSGHLFDFGVIASFGYLIPERIINRFPLGILNVHASLLPRWRGAAPIPHAIMFGDSVSGVSIMKIAPHKFDVGPVLYQQSVPIHPHIRRPELTTILAQLGADALSNVISDLENYLANPIPQDETKARLSPKLVPEMAEVDWCSKSAVEIYNLFRSLYGVFKLKTTFLSRKVDLDEVGLVTLRKNNSHLDISPSAKTLKVVNIHTDFSHFYPIPAVQFVENTNHLPNDARPGQIVFNTDILYVKCVEKVGESKTEYFPWVSVRKIKVGSKWMAAKDFRNGFLSKCKPELRIFSFSTETQESDPTPNVDQDKVNNSRTINR